MCWNSPSMPDLPTIQQPSLQQPNYAAPKPPPPPPPPPNRGASSYANLTTAGAVTMQDQRLPLRQRTGISSLTISRGGSGLNPGA